MERSNNCLPKDLKCPKCSIELELEENERKSKKFICPSCKSEIDYNESLKVNDVNNSTDGNKSHNTNEVLENAKLKGSRIEIGKCPKCGKPARVKAWAVKSVMHHNCTCGYQFKIEPTKELIELSIKVPKREKSKKTNNKSTHKHSNRLGYSGLVFIAGLIYFFLRDIKAGKEDPLFLFIILIIIIVGYLFWNRFK